MPHTEDLSDPAKIAFKAAMPIIRGLYEGLAQAFDKWPDSTFTAQEVALIIRNTSDGIQKEFSQ